MERPLSGDELRAPGGEPGDLECPLHRFRPAVAEEAVLQVAWRDAGEFRPEPARHLIEQQTRGERRLPQLLAGRLDDALMGVAHGEHAESAEEVDVLRAGVGPHDVALALGLQLLESHEAQEGDQGGVHVLVVQGGDFVEGHGACLSPSCQ